MNQLLIVKSDAALNGGAKAPTDLSQMAKGAIGFAELGADTWLSAKPTKPFMIALGNGVGQVPFIIPEVPVDFTAVKGEAQAGKHFKATVTTKALKAGQEASVTVILAGKHFNERTNFSATVKATPFADMTAAEVATAVAKTFTNQNIEDALHLKATANGATVTFEDADSYQDYNIVGENVTIAISSHALKPTGDKASIEWLSEFSRGAKGFRYVTEKPKSLDMYHGEPEAVEDTEYILYTLRFAVARAASKWISDNVPQIVRIAIPKSSPAVATIETILGLSAEAAAAKKSATESEG